MRELYAHQSCATSRSPADKSPPSEHRALTPSQPGQTSRPPLTPHHRSPPLKMPKKKMAPPKMTKGKRRPGVPASQHDEEELPTVPSPDSPPPAAGGATPRSPTPSMPRSPTPSMMEEEGEYNNCDCFIPLSIFLAPL